MSVDPTKPATAKCNQCGRQVVDGSTDFGGVVLRPTCKGIEVSSYMAGRSIFITEDELRDFLERAYG